MPEASNYSTSVWQIKCAAKGFDFLVAEVPVVVVATGTYWGYALF